MRSIVWELLRLPGSQTEEFSLRSWAELFGEAYARSADPDTSHDAAEAVKASRLEMIVLETLAKLGGRATIKEVAAACGIDKWSLSPRFASLARKGYIRATAERR